MYSSHPWSQSEHNHDDVEHNAVSMQMSQPLFHYPLVQAPHLEDHFYKHLQNFLVSHNLPLEIADIKTATPPQ